jgi:hypothetical protein
MLVGSCVFRISIRRTSLRQAHVEALLHDEPVATRLPLFLGLGELEIVLQEKGGDEFGPARKPNCQHCGEKGKQNDHKGTHISIQLMFLPKHILAPAPKAKKNLCMSP